QVADDEPRPGDTENGEPHPRRVELAGTHAPPGGRPVDELVAGHVTRREGDPELSHRGVVELGVEQAPRVAGPVLAHPVVLQESPVEVACEARAAARREAV